MVTRTTQKPDFPIPAAPRGEEYVTLENFNRMGKDIAFQGKILNWTFGFLVAVLVVCVVAFITFLLDAWRFHSTTYDEYRNVLQEVKTYMQETKETPEKETQNEQIIQPNKKSDIKMYLDIRAEEKK